MIEFTDSDEQVFDTLGMHAPTIDRRLEHFDAFGVAPPPEHLDALGVTLPPKGMGALGDDEVLEGMDAWFALDCLVQRRMLRWVAEADRRELWRNTEAHGTAHMVSMRFGISWWKADRWVHTARALERLPRISAAFERGQIGIDKVVELCRFATPDSEGELLRWAQGVSSGAIRDRADLELRRHREEAEQVDQGRSLHYRFFDEGRRFSLEADLPAAEGAVVARRIERLAAELPAMPDEEGPWFAEARRADALVALCSEGGDDVPAADDRFTVVVHASAEALASVDRSCRIEGGGLAHVETVRRLGCFSRLQVVVEDQGGNPVAVGRTFRDPSIATMRQLRYRDVECRFPGCGARRFTQAHHIRWWSRGGRTELGNLVLLCSFHHKLVHEYGWSLAREPDNTVRWSRPDGTPYRSDAMRGVLSVDNDMMVWWGTPAEIRSALGER